MWKQVSISQVAAVMLLAFSSLNAQATAKPASKPSPSDQPAAETLKIEVSAQYIIQPSDVLEIYVWKEPEVSRKSVLVRPDGRISIPLVQDIQAAGLSPSDLKVQIENKLKDSMAVPNVTVMVDTIQSFRVFVTGKVQKPGEIKEDKPITVLHALALAGNFLEFSNPSEITIVRNAGNDKTVYYRFNYDEFAKGKNPAQNILLKPGDVVLVP